MGVGEFVHELFHLFLDNLGPIVLIVCLVAGVSFATWNWYRSKARKEMQRDIEVYAEALKDVTTALKTSNETLSATQTALGEAQAELKVSNQTNVELNRANGELKAALEKAGSKLDAVEKQLCDYQAATAKLSGELEAVKTSKDDMIATLTAKITDLQTLVATLQEQLRTGAQAHASEVKRLELLLKASEDARLKAEADLRNVQTEIDALRKAIKQPTEAEGSIEPADPVEPAQEPQEPTDTPAESPSESLAPASE